MAVTDTQRAYDLIKERIITTQMAPGSIIHESTLMADLGLGRTPIREALKLLEAEKLVVVAPRRGMFVAGINITDLAQIQEVRCVLEPLCVRLATMRIGPAELAELRSLVGQAEAAAQRRDVEALMTLDRRFHHLMAQATRNDLLAGEMDMLYNLSLRIWHFYLDRLDPTDLAFDALVKILKAVENRDATAAERAMLEHILHFGEAVKEHL